MSLSIAFAGILAGVVVWWLAVRRLTTKPWEAQGSADGRELPGASSAASARVGLWIFLAVITSLFALFITAYYMRMGHGMAHGLVHDDWHPVIEPRILWFNTALLVLGSVSMQWARTIVRRDVEGDIGRARAAWLAGGVFAVGFLAGQLMAWRQLQAAGFYAASNPANAFFYVLTGVHGIHLLGGLWVWARTALRMHGAGPDLDPVRLSVQLCTVYWHYLLVVWIVLFGLLLLT